MLKDFWKILKILIKREKEYYKKDVTIPNREMTNKRWVLLKGGFDE